METKSKVVLLNILNIIDALATLRIIVKLEATELNPMMAYLFQVHPIVFIITKVSIVLMATLFILKNQENRFAKSGLDILLRIYFVLILYHYILFILY